MRRVMTQPNRQYMPSTLTSNGAHIAIGMLTRVTEKVEPWCSVVHHSTEYLMMGILKIDVVN